MTTEIEFWFDPSCPFTWQTSRWARELEGAGAVGVRWRVMSLPILHEGREVPGHDRETNARAARALRVLVAAEDEGGSGALGRLYAAVGVLVHDQGRTLDEGVLAKALADTDLPGSLLEAADDPGRDEAVRESHEESQERVGHASGSPITAYDGGPGYFGPVVVPAPLGDDAHVLLTAMSALSTVPGFSEVKRTRPHL